MIRLYMLLYLFQILLKSLFMGFPIIKEDGTEESILDILLNEQLLLLES